MSAVDHPKEMFACWAIPSAKTVHGRRPTGLDEEALTEPEGRESSEERQHHSWSYCPGGRARHGVSGMRWLSFML